MEESIKTTIKDMIAEKQMSIFNLARASGINVLKLVFILYIPRYRIKLSHAIRICKALKISISDLV